MGFRRIVRPRRAGIRHGRDVLEKGGAWPMMPLADALSVFTVPFVGYPIVCVSVVALTFRLIRSFS